MANRTRLNRRQMLGACLFSLGWSGIGWSKSTAPGGPAASLARARTSRLLQSREDLSEALVESDLEQPREEVSEQSTLLSLDIHELSGDDGIVQVSVSVNNPASRDSHISSILVLAEKNPQPLIKTFFFSADHSKKTVSTRCRLVCSQRVVVVAKMKNGDLQSVGRDVVFHKSGNKNGQVT